MSCTHSLFHPNTSRRFEPNGKHPTSALRLLTFASDVSAAWSRGAVDIIRQWNFEVLDIFSWCGSKTLVRVWKGERSSSGWARSPYAQTRPQKIKLQFKCTFKTTPIQVQHLQSQNYVARTVYIMISFDLVAPNSGQQDQKNTIRQGTCCTCTGQGSAAKC